MGGLRQTSVRRTRTRAPLSGAVHPSGGDFQWALLGLEEGRVRFRWRDSQDKNQIKETSLDAVEFIRRFLLHVLPSGFVKIRHFGFLSNRNRRAMVQRCRELLPPSAPLLVVTERQKPVCPVCGVGHLHVIEPSSTAPLHPNAAPHHTPHMDSS